MTRLLLIGLLTVLSFSVFAEFNENPIPEWVEPKVDGSQFGYDCRAVGGALLKPQITLEACQTFLFERLSYPTTPCNTVTCKWYKISNPHLKAGSCVNGLPNCIFQFDLTSYTVVSGGRVSEYLEKDQDMGYANNNKPITVKSCPPTPDSPYTVGPVPESDQNPTHEVCKQKFKPCPLGYFAKEVTTSGGVSQCVPVNCPNKGVQSNSIANWNSILKVNDTGIYCDGRCAYQLDSVSYTGASFVTGTSLGLICGQGNPSDAKLTPKDSESSCETHQLSSGSSFITCDGATQEPTEPDTGEGDLQPAADSAKVDPAQKPSKYQGADCTNATDKMVCVGTDIVKALDHQTEQTKLQDDEKHNKNILFQLAINEYLEKNNRERANRLSADMQNQTQQFVYGINSVTTAINQNGGSGSGGSGLGKDELDDSLDKLVENFDGDSVIAQLASFLDEKQSQIDAANAELDSKMNEGLAKFNDSDPLWTPFKQLPDILPVEYACQPFTLSLDEHPLVLDFCEYEELIKNVIGFVFILLTGLRLFYQAQVIIRNAAIGSA